MSHCFVQIGESKFINMDRVTHVEPEKRGALTVRFSVGSGQYADYRDVTLDAQEAARLLNWLDAHSQRME